MERSQVVAPKKGKERDLFVAGRPKYAFLVICENNIINLISNIRYCDNDRVDFHETLCNYSEDNSKTYSVLK